MNSAPVIKWNQNFTGEIKDLEFKDIGIALKGKCIAILNGHDILIQRILADNFSKCVADVRGVTNLVIKDVYGDAKLNAEENFCKGLQIGFTIDGDEAATKLNACKNILIENYTVQNIKYGGTSNYKNGDGITVEPFCENIEIRQFLLKNKPDDADAGGDFKSPVKAYNGRVIGWKRGLRCWGNHTFEYTDISIEDCIEGIWLPGNAKLILTRVAFKNCTRPISDDNGNSIPLTDPRITILDAGEPIIVPPTFGPGAVPTPIPVPAPSGMIFITSGYWRLIKNGVEVSKHTKFEEVVEKGTNIMLSEKSSKITYDYDGGRIELK